MSNHSTSTPPQKFNEIITEIYYHKSSESINFDKTDDQNLTVAWKLLGAKKIAVDNYTTIVDGTSTNKDDNLAESLILAIEKEMESDNRKNARIYSLLATQVIQDPYGKGRKRYDKVKENLKGITEFAFTKGADGKQVFLFFKATGKLEKRWNEDVTGDCDDLKAKVEVVRNNGRGLNGRTNCDSVEALTDVYSAFEGCDISR